MKAKLLLFFFFLFQMGSNVWAQTPGFVFSSIRRPIQNKQDSLLLIRNEQMMWMQASKGNVMMFDNPMLDCEFKVRMSKMAIQSCFKDSIPLKSGASDYLMNLMENDRADTCFIMSFSPFLPHHYQERVRWVQDSTHFSKLDTNNHKTPTGIFSDYGHWQMGPWQTGLSVQFLMPLSEYPAFIPKNEMKQANIIYEKQFASLLNGKLSGDTIYRIVRFTCDSNEYLPQSPYANLISCLKNNLLAGEYHAFANRNLDTRLSKMGIENALVGWDSTNQVEDPNNPGIFILAPIKIEGQPKSFLIYERWIPFSSQIYNTSFLYTPKVYMPYKREVLAYGLLLSNQSVLWLSSAEINKFFLQSKYNMTPYEECFRAERFKTMQIQVHTW